MRTEDIEKLSGADLDRAVAEKIGLAIVGHEDGAVWVRDDAMRCYPFTPSASWAQLGPLLEEHRIAIYPTTARGLGAGHGQPGWLASSEPGSPFVSAHSLTAGCRALLSGLYARG